MSQKLESDFLKAARKLRQKKRRQMLRRVGIFFLIIALAAGLAVLLFKDGSILKVGSMELGQKILVLSIIGLILSFTSFIYFTKLQSSNSPNNSPSPTSRELPAFVQIKNLRFIKIKYVLGFSLLLLALILQGNPALFRNVSGGFITNLKYNPTPPSLSSPWSWENQNMIHPVVAGMTSDVETSIQSVAEYIAQKESDPYLRIKAIHDYVISRVTYDLDVLKTGKRPPQDAKTVFSTGKAVCEGYANLFMALGQEIGIDVVYIIGNIREALAPLDLIPPVVRQFEYNYDWTLHAWNAVKVEGNWQLVDTTWDDGDSSNYRTDYLMPPPEMMIVSHLPEMSDWQLLEDARSQKHFENQPLLKPQFFRENLEIISPTEYETSSQKTAVIEIKTAPDYQKQIGAFFVEVKKPEFSVWSLLGVNQSEQESQVEEEMCQSQQNLGEIIQISCQFPQPGDYQVLLVSFEQDSNWAGNRASFIGQLSFNYL